MSWSEMFIQHHDTNKNGFVISYEEPIKYEGNKKIIIEYSISNLDEICDFYRKYNTMSSGNITLLPKSVLELYLSYNNITVLMRSENGKLMGVIISIILPVKCSNNSEEKIIDHGCTTFLVVHPSIRGHGMCMALIRGLIQKGYERKLYCDYHTISFKLGSNSIPLKSYYRPINIERSIELGFLFPGYNNIRMKTRNRLLYNNKLKKEYKYIKIGEYNLEQGLKYYRESITDKKFSFWPDEILWKKWIEGFPTYLIYYKDIISGIVSINTIYCIISTTNKEGKVASPIIFNGHIDMVLNVLPNIVEQEGFDVLYFHSYGDASSELLEKNHYIKTQHLIWFSLYNNCIKLDSKDITVPFL